MSVATNSETLSPFSAGQVMDLIPSQMGLKRYPSSSVPSNGQQNVSQDCSGTFRLIRRGRGTQSWDRCPPHQEEAG